MDPLNTNNTNSLPPQSNTESSPAVSVPTDNNATFKDVFTRNMEGAERCREESAKVQRQIKNSDRNSAQTSLLKREQRVLELMARTNRGMAALSVDMARTEEQRKALLKKIEHLEKLDAAAKAAAAKAEAGNSSL